MSALAPARSTRSTRPARHTERPALRLVVTRPLRAGRLPFALLVSGILALGLVALLMLHTIAAQDAFQAQAMQQRLASLDDRVQQLSMQQQRREAPANLAARARALGMRPTGSIAFVRTHSGRTVGVVPAPSPAPVVAAPTPAAQPTSAPSTHHKSPHRRASASTHG